ncbi:hypothetical protein DL765_006249 [Monosporascus sp. GIB2]|nr:hypothetical protein DL765_006249 [Monosporascus sp. GIB2]
MAYPTTAVPKPPPPLNIPVSNHIVKVSIIDNTTIVNLPLGIMVKPAALGGLTHVTCPSYSFLIEHQSGRKLLFDLGVRKDWESQAPSAVKLIKDARCDINVDKDVYDILVDNGHDPKAVEAIFWSRNPARFPSSTALVVGPGFKGRFPPAWPTVEDSFLKEESWEGRELKEVRFDTELKIGRFKAVDWFGDGSFYLLDTPGHLLGHICALARTTPYSFILMGADAAHHADGFNEDEPVAEQSLEGVMEFDAHENILVVLAHDTSLREVLGFFPQNANDWKKKLWHDKGRWRFLADFEAGLKSVEDMGV